MKIEELIKYYEWRLEQTKDFSDPHWEASERREHREFVERLETVISLLKELKWYRSQDLIRREDVWNCRPEWLNENMEDAIKSTHNKGWNECNLEWYDTIIQTPKVEYKEVE